MRKSACSAAVALCLLTTALLQPSQAQQKQVPATFGNSMVPPPEVLAGLIRWTLTAVSQATATGNYTVVRELGSPNFQKEYTVADLARAFGGFRQQSFDLSFVILVTPELSQPPAIDGEVLRLVGFYPTRPVQVNFELKFELVGGTWRHSHIALAAGPPTEPPAAQPPPPAAKQPNRQKPRRRK